MKATEIKLYSPIEAPVSPILNPSSGAFMPSNLEKRTFENETNGFYPQNEFTDFMNRRKEVETYTTANATTSSSSARPASPSKITIVNSKPIMSAPATPIQISVKPSMPSPDPSSHMIDERALKKAAYRASIESLEIALPSDPVQAYIPPPVQQHQQQQKKKETAVGDSPLQDRPAPPKRGAFGGDIQVKTSKDSLASRDSLLKSNAGNSAAESNSNSAPPTPASIEATPKPPVRSSLLNINTSKQNLNSNNNKDVNALKSPAAPKDDKDMDDEKEEDMKNAISPSPMATTAKDTAPISAVSPPSPSSLAPVTAAANSAAAATAATGAPATTGSTPSTAVVPAGDTQGLGLNCKSPLAVGLKIFK